jgi:hypothetical protein
MGATPAPDGRGVLRSTSLKVGAPGGKKNLHLLTVEGGKTVGLTGLFLLGFLFDGEDFASRVVTALGANGVTPDHLATVRALHQAHGGQGIVCATAVTASLG